MFLSDKKNPEKLSKKKTCKVNGLTTLKIECIYTYLWDFI